ncbi:T9SS type A sorting domain-containing protein [Draconibacterium sediminis]|uniref:T9SS type A sorting domain-containing protein n=1 Tax=Draconibacterium sediminis TaxID=1544798 RepID=UPI000698D5AC|nr:T9SS type A sorting domain-containing protein [Draconibacterium sediminis]
MKNAKLKIIASLCSVIFCTTSLLAQETNCFLEDFTPKNATIPGSVAASKTVNSPTVTVTLSADTLGKISNYVFGNAIAVWMGNNTDNPTFVENTQLLNPSLIRFPGGSWSNIFFWDGAPSDIPDSAYDSSGERVKFYAISGKNDWPTTTGNYYKLREQTGSQGLITINYGYARYGLSDNPVAQAAHLAAQWVRYDNGRTKFWEIGNENAGPWEAGWKIDTNTNKDGQPEIISGQLYGRHFRVFADSMRAAAAEVGATIYIGAQVLHFDGTTSWNSVDGTWNEGVFSEIGDGADFYVMHNYFGSDANADNLLMAASTEPRKNIDFIQQDIMNNNAFQKPVAITEYNINSNSANPTMGHSYINGMQATILYNELIKNNFGLGARWLLASGEDGMFYQGDDVSLRWQPRPDFYYAYYTQKFTGDHVINATSDNTTILAYASKFASGETGIVLVNKGKTAQVVKIDPLKIGVGDQYYNYSLTGGTDNGDFSMYVTVNDERTTGTQWGPRETLETIPANAFSIGSSIKLEVPARSVQFIMIEAGDNLLYPTSVASELKNGSDLTNFPNPFTDITTIQFRTSLNALVVLDVFDYSGKKISTLISKELPSGTHQVDFDGSLLPAGLYFYQLKIGNSATTRKMILSK